MYMDIKCHINAFFPVAGSLGEDAVTTAAPNAPVDTPTEAPPAAVEPEAPVEGPVTPAPEAPATPAPEAPAPAAAEAPQDEGPSDDKKTTTAAPTTPAPTTTSTAAPTPSPTPTPDKYFRVTENNVTCIMFSGDVKFSVSYPTVSGEVGAIGAKDCLENKGSVVNLYFLLYC